MSTSVSITARTTGAMTMCPSSRKRERRRRPKEWSGECYPHADPLPDDDTELGACILRRYGSLALPSDDEGLGNERPQEDGPKEQRIRPLHGQRTHDPHSNE